MTQGQIIDPQQLPLDSQGVRYRAPAGATFVRIRARVAAVAVGRYREPGDVFNYPLAEGEELPSWADRVADGTEIEPERARRAQDAIPLMSHMEPAQPADAGDTFSGAAHAHHNVL